MSKMIKIDEEYKKWVEDISKRFRKSQIKAAMKVNDEMLRFYWSLGCDMDRIKENYDWGSHFYSQISKDIQKVLPDVKSFSSRNLLYMHQFYRMYPDALITPQVGAQLTEEEFAVIKTHPVIGNQILKNITQSPHIGDGAYYHHERYDGKGYPEGLAGSDIPDIGRIIAVADAYDAMTSKRSYRDILPQDQVRSEIE